MRSMLEESVVSTSIDIDVDLKHLHLDVGGKKYTKRTVKCQRSTGKTVFTSNHKP